MALEIKTKFMTGNDCYTTGRKITPKGIMIHSTATPGVMAAEWFSRWNKSYTAGETNRQVCVHAFVDDKEVWQYLPWNHRGWHAGGKANDTHIGIEICEPGGFYYSSGEMKGYDARVNEEYFKAAWDNAVNLCVFLCRVYGFSGKDIIGHYEGYRMGIASNHADPLHWFSKHSMDMEGFRKEVSQRLNAGLELEDAVKILNQKGIIRSPEYWTANAREGSTVKGEYAAILIKRMAEYITHKSEK